MNIANRSLIALTLLALVAATAGAVVQERSGSRLADKLFVAPEMEIVGNVTRLMDLPQDVRSSSLQALQNLGVEQQAGLMDTRGGRWGTLYPSVPLVPGDGFGNNLSWDGFGERPQGDEAMRQFVWQRLSEYMREREASLGVDVEELAMRSGIWDDGALVSFSGSRVYGGLPVRTAAFSAVVNSGNISLMGTYAWGDIELELTPRLSADLAVAVVSEYIAPLSIESLRTDAHLEIVPTARGGSHAFGQGYDHHLVWVVNADIQDEFGQWEALVDAHSGRLMSFQDLNHYGTARNIDGGHYPVTYDNIDPDGVMQPNYPMPYADVSVGGPFTDAGGNFVGVGLATTTLNGQFVRIDDQCAGTFNESSTGDIELGGTNGDVDCDTPTSGDNTASARSGFYEVNRIIELAQGQLPANTWLTNQLEANMNINNSCNAFWNGVTINFYREGGGCGNTGQIGSVFDHEWGHGMDDNDVNGQIISSTNGGGEGIADIYGSLRLDTSCVGRGFCQGTGICFAGTLCNGYGDPCTAASGCSGIRDIDFANKTSGLPHDLSWMQANPSCTSPHCRGVVYAEAIWDLFKRDLPAVYGMDNNTAMEVSQRLAYVAGGNVAGWYSTGGAVHANCSASFGYNQYLAADDDNGNLLDGTPHMTAIWTAFDRHEIDCSPANGGPTVQDGGCPSNPTTQPAVTVTAGDMTATLSWGAVPDAATYNIYRTDGIFGCDFGKALVGSTASTGFADSGLKNAHPYSYVVIPMGSGGASCFGPASDCDTIGGIDIFADGFESGDTSTWSTTVP